MDQLVLNAEPPKSRDIVYLSTHDSLGTYTHAFVIQSAAGDKLFEIRVNGDIVLRGSVIGNDPALPKIIEEAFKR